MANVMTPSLSHPEFIAAFRAQIGVRRADGKCPYEAVMCMNSGMRVCARVCFSFPFVSGWKSDMVTRWSPDGNMDETSYICNVHFIVPTTDGQTHILAHLPSFRNK